MGAFLGSGHNAKYVSSFLMGCFNETDDAWQVVCKVSNGFKNDELKELTEAMIEGDEPLMERLDPNAPLPSWMPPLAGKGQHRPQYVHPVDPRERHPRKRENRRAERKYECEP